MRNFYPIPHMSHRLESAGKRVNAAAQNVLPNRRMRATTINEYDQIITNQKLNCQLWNTHYATVLTAEQKLAESSYIRDSIFQYGYTVSYLLANHCPSYLDIGIAFRPTAAISQTGIEQGFPVKPVEIKNKTAKIEDYFILKAMTSGTEYYEAQDIIGFVLHYNPLQHFLGVRALTATDAHFDRVAHCVYTKMREEIEFEYNEKIRIDFSLPGHPGVMMVDHHSLCPTVTVSSIKKTIEKRFNEFHAEEVIYRNLDIEHPGLVKRECPFVKLRTMENQYQKVVGDHDLFCFCDIKSDGTMIPYIEENKDLLEMLSMDRNVLTQHGGIYYWRPDPSKSFEQGIKKAIMGAHGPESTEPLIVITKDDVRVCYYDDTRNELISVWDKRINNRSWLLRNKEGRNLWSSSVK